MNTLINRTRSGSCSVRRVLRAVRDSAVTVLSRLLRAIDLLLYVSPRARACMEAAVRASVPVSVMYDGGLEITPASLVPHMMWGPPRSNTPGEVFIVLRPGAPGPLSVRRALTESSAGENWLFVEPSGLGRRYEIQKRLDTDYWLPEAEYQDVFRTLASQCHPIGESRCRN